MPFIAEDGTGVEDANAAVSVEFADTYMADRGRVAWADLLLAQKQAVIIDATTFLETSYTPIGDIKSATQGLLWPRVNATDRQGRTYSDQVPLRWKEACCELAWLSRTDPLIASATEAAIKRVKAGPVEVEFKDGNRVSEDDKFAWVNRMLSHLLLSQAGGNNIALLKA